MYLFRSPRGRGGFDRSERDYHRDRRNKDRSRYCHNNGDIITYPLICVT